MDSSPPAADPGAVAPALELVAVPVPEPGRVEEIAPGVLWLRMPLPFALDHVNLWLLADGAGWAVVDTGICRDEIKASWKRIISRELAPRPITRIFVTHHHPDHIGLAGWLAAETGAEVFGTRKEWRLSRRLYADTDGARVARQLEQFRRHGLTGEALAAFRNMGNPYRRAISVPPEPRPIGDGTTFGIAGREWRIVVGTGHAPEHACLHCPELGVLIAGDQVLPGISPNISLFASSLDPNPLASYLASLERFMDLPADTLVLPSHGVPFRGLPVRLEQLRRHHHERLARLHRACAAERSAADLLPVLFPRELDIQQTMFAMGEALAHLEHLRIDGRLRSRAHEDGVIRYRLRD